MQNQDVRSVWVQITQAEEEAFKSKPKPKKKVELPPLPALPLKIDHNFAKWYLEEFLGVNEENGEKIINQTSLGSKISVFFAKIYGITTVFNEDGKLVLKSQIYNPKERDRALVLFSLNNQFTGELLINALEKLESSELTIINAWLSPVVITTTKGETHKAVWEIKKTALRNLINYMKQNEIPTLVGRELMLGLTKKKEGMRVWCEPFVDDKTQPSKRVEEVSEEVLKLAFEFLSEFEDYKNKFNSLTFKQDDEIPTEL